MACHGVARHAKGRAQGVYNLFARPRLGGVYSVVVELYAVLAGLSLGAFGARLALGALLPLWADRALYALRPLGAGRACFPFFALRARRTSRAGFSLGPRVASLPGSPLRSHQVNGLGI